MTTTKGGDAYVVTPTEHSGHDDYQAVLSLDIDAPAGSPPSRRTASTEAS